MKPLVAIHPVSSFFWVVNMAALRKTILLSRKDSVSRTILLTFLHIKEFITQIQRNVTAKIWSCFFLSPMNRGDIAEGRQINGFVKPSSSEPKSFAANFCIPLVNPNAHYSCPMKSILFPIVLLLWLTAGCTTRNLESAELSFETMEMPANRSYESGLIAIFENRGAVERFYGSSDAPLPPIPEVDFSRNLVVGIIYPVQSGCTSFADAVSGVFETPGHLRLSFSFDGDLGPCRALVHPQQFVKIPRTNLPVRFTGDLPASDKVVFD
jgi:hypothetical protein